jgi:hypothetical protein
MAVIYTNAPECYDGFSTVTLAVVGSDRKGNPVRKVEIDERDFAWQTGRYGSGMYPWTFVGPGDSADWQLRSIEGYRCTFDEFVKGAKLASVAR